MMMDKAITGSFNNVSEKAAGGSAGGYLNASLRFMTADTREGLDSAAREDFNAIKAQAQAAPHNAALGQYVARFSAPAAARAKPSLACS